MVLSSMQLQKVWVTLGFRRLQCLILRSVLSVFINLRSAECVCSQRIALCFHLVLKITFSFVMYSFEDMMIFSYNFDSVNVAQVTIVQKIDNRFTKYRL